MRLAPRITVDLHLPDLAIVKIFSWAKIDHNNALTIFGPEHILGLYVTMNDVQLVNFLYTVAYFAEGKFC